VIVGKLFLPLAAPGFTSLGLGALAVVQGGNATSTLQVAAIVVGLVVVAVAGIFTIRSNVAKVWREQAEGEKARVATLTNDLAEARRENAEALAAATLQHAAELAKLLHDLEEERSVRTRLDTELVELRQKTDLSVVVAKLDELLGRMPVAA